MKELRKGLVLLMLGIGGPLLAQSLGEIHGKVVDDNGAPVPFVSVGAEQGAQRYSAQSDMDGNYVLKPLPVGVYTMRFISSGFPAVEITGVRVDADLINVMTDVVMTSLLKEVPIIVWTDPLIREDDPGRMTMSSLQIRTNAGRKDPVKMIASFNPGVTKSPNGDGLYFRGSRSDAMAYYIDGVKVTGGLSGVPSDAINSINVYTGGLPAKYGDVTGGVIAIETKSYFDLYQQRNAGNP